MIFLFPGSRRLRPEHCVYRGFTLALLLVLSGCSFFKLATTHFEKPVFTYLRSELVSTTQSQATVNFILSAHNPNKTGIKNASVSYELSVEGKRLLRGTDVPFDLMPDGDTELMVPAVLEYRDLSPVLGSVVERMLSGRRTVPITIHAVFSGKPAITTVDGEEKPVFFEMHMTKTADVPLTRDRTNRGKRRQHEVVKDPD